MTHGRIAQLFNSLKLTNQTAHLHPLMEHLEAMRMHMRLAQSPQGAFLSVCPLHTMASAGDAPAGCLKREAGGAPETAITLFAFFTKFDTTFRRMG
jgi:hypothetical protein